MSISFLCLLSFFYPGWVVNTIKCCFHVSSVNTIQGFEFGVEPHWFSQNKRHTLMVLSSFLHIRVSSVQISCLDFSVHALIRKIFFFLLYFLKTCFVLVRGAGLCTCVGACRKGQIPGSWSYRWLWATECEGKEPDPGLLEGQWAPNDWATSPAPCLHIYL